MFANRVLVVAVLCGGVTCAPATAGDKGAKPAPPGTYAFAFKDAKWDDVFDAYAKLTGLTLTAPVELKGAFTYAPPKPGQQLTLAEITDVINLALLAQEQLLIRRHDKFVVVPTHEEIDPTLVSRITADELGKRGLTEMVQVVIPAAENLAATIKKTVGPFGTVVALTSKDGFIVQDFAGNVATIKKKVDELSAPKPAKK